MLNYQMKSLWVWSIEQLPQIVQQYSSADFISALNKIFLPELDK